ncbi:GDP-L-fucose synthase [Pigmentibacter sp. JX0631]|uniref:GDP-L-fucose synthase family protein n=1 Tax=Pigmentibacter sp. JX0631 TaxID=2976982 RepID=UPI002469B7E5|nr:GDP-L-fucose synthase [Pigmentibacter sp. JX0631]WGL60858.1 GDP-L-fucose synthase [Pigmentibacter sp. JX0631]
MNKSDKIFVAGHAGLAGTAIVESLEYQGFSNIITRTRSELDLLNLNSVQEFFQNVKPDVVILAAAKVGGIHANNTFRADFIFENLQIQSNVIWSAHVSNVHRLVFLGSSCIYPKNCPQPIKEEYLLSGKLEYTNQPYAIAKIAGIELINSLRKQYNRDYFCVMPTNLFGKNDNYHPENSHVIASLIRKICEAKFSNKKEVIVWGDGTPLREFMYSRDLGDAVSFLAANVSFKDLEQCQLGKLHNLSHINVGSGVEISIKELAYKISSLVKYEGNINFDLSKPNGTSRKLMDCSILKELGWESKANFDESLSKTIVLFNQLKL